MPEQRRDHGIDGWVFRPGEIIREDTDSDSADAEPAEYTVQRTLRDTVSGERVYHIMDKDGDTGVVTASEAEARFRRITPDESRTWSADAVPDRYDATEDTVFDAMLMRTIHEQLSDYGLKEFRTHGADRQYVRGYCDALEWVVNNPLKSPDR